MSEVSLHGKTIIVTGASSGFGLVTATTLAGMGARVVMVCRSSSNGEAARREILATHPGAELELALADLSSQMEIRAFVRRFERTHDRLDVLVNNAGIQRQRREETTDGIEVVFATNVLAYHLLISLFAPLLEKSRPARIVNVASDFAGEFDLDDLQFRRRRYTAVRAYKQSKAADRLLSWVWSRALEDRGITVNAAAPGLVMTGLYESSPWPVRAVLGLVHRFVGRTVEEGADTIAWLASSPEVEGRTGRFFDTRLEKTCEFGDASTEHALFAACERLVAGTAEP